ncbi:hypothetical protein [Parafrankia sp. EUN1f]|uniref:hypothetical protein n=1 Tax=Parafrankia sp. EUN1f TaxID=102897 RepID=UPI0001C4645A|nr:hypothetical protein [Parafrankia sp. EUN1f]EFC80890.1 hypothetical protein FrEUN1fDRAFT_5992 [Parafrankia sp. EUN1f]
MVAPVQVARGPYMVTLTTSHSPVAVGMTPKAWLDFIDAVKRGEFDDFAHPTINMEDGSCPQPSLPE